MRMTDRPGPRARPAELSRRSVLLGGVVVVGGALLGPRMSCDAPPPTVTTTVRTGTDPIGTVPAGLVGFSFERRTLTTPLFRAANGPLVALFRLLGPSVLRLGGNTVERVGWDRSGAGQAPSVVGPPDLADLRGFLDAVGWQAFHGTPFATGTASSVADEASIASAILGPTLAAVALCNEPDIYFLDAALKAVVPDHATFLARWGSFAAAIRDATDIPLAGPDTCLLQSSQAWTVDLAGRGAAAPEWSTQHYYRGLGNVGSIDGLLQPDPLLVPVLDRLAATAPAGRYRLSETNSYSSGGAPGVSNTLASALWALRLVFTAAERGAAGVNLHNSGTGAGYPAIVQVGGEVTEVRPLFAGLLLAAQAGSGRLLPTTVEGTQIEAWSVQRGDGSVGVVLSNPSAADLVVDLPSPGLLTGPTVLRLEGGSLAATTGVTVGGVAVAPDGSWPAPRREPLPVTKLGTTVAVPAASAALVEYRLAPA